jgi:hypothetical protein
METASSTTVAGKTEYLLKLDPRLSPYTNINSNWIKDLNISPETLKQLQETVENTLEQIGIGSNFSASKRKNEQMGMHETKKHTKRNSH